MNTHKSVSIVLAFGCFWSTLAGQELVNLAEDTAGNYQGGWESGSNGGYGFGPWQLVAEQGEGASYAGFFAGRKEDQPDLTGITRHMAFGVYANGAAFEEAVAFRPFAEALRPGEAFSVLLEHGKIRPNSDRGAQSARSVGLALRSGNAADDASDATRGVRFAFGLIEGEKTYRIIDGEDEGIRDSGVPITEEGVELTFILTGPDRYDLQLKILASDRVHEWKDRRLGGEPGATIESFAIFNRDAEPQDLYFEGLQINRATEGD